MGMPPPGSLDSEALAQMRPGGLTKEGVQKQKGVMYLEVVEVR